MTQSLHLFMNRLIDYAGLFPPAMLDMPAAVRTYSRHLDSEFSWMLGCFICPVGRLAEFEAERSMLARHGPVAVSVLGTKPDGTADLADKARTDAATVTALEKSGWAHGHQLEVKWPTSLIDSHELGRYVSALASAGCSFEHVFFEIERGQNWERDLVIMTDALAEAGGSVGFKIRTGGVTSDLYPSAKEVAVAIEACRDAGVRFKATAGLHHPVSYDRSDPETTEHGFLNVFVAAAIAHSRDANRQMLTDVLEERDPSRFAFGEDSLQWQDVTVPLADLRDSRSRLGYSFGSCNFDEPIEDLRVLGLL